MKVSFGIGLADKIITTDCITLSPGSGVDSGPGSSGYFNLATTTTTTATTTTTTTSSSKKKSKAAKEEKSVLADASTEVLLIDIPSTVTIQDILQFVAPVRSTIKCIRELRSTVPQVYTVLTSFVTVDAAIEFIKCYNGRPYSFAERNLCSLGLLRSSVIDQHRTLVPQRSQHVDKCPICLEPLKKGEGALVMLLCGHSYHAECLSQCLELKCAVCRYTRQSVVHNQCNDCDAKEELWMCLTCGHIGCGRQQWLGDGMTNSTGWQAHALKHYTSVGHAFTQNVETQQVWNYATDRYCRQIGEDASQKKMVEMEDPHDNDLDQSGLSEQDAQAGLTLEYIHLLTTQLEQHRRTYVENLAACEREAHRSVQRSEEMLKDCVTYRNQRQAGIDRASKELATIMKETRRLQAATTLAQDRGREEKEVADSMQDNLPLWEKELVLAHKVATEAAQANETALVRLQLELEQQLQLLDS